MFEGYYFILYAAGHADEVRKESIELAARFGVEDPVEIPVEEWDEPDELRDHLTNHLATILLSAASDIGICTSTVLSETDIERLVHCCEASWEEGQRLASDLIDKDARLKRIQNPLRDKDVVMSVWKHMLDQRRRLPTYEQFFGTPSMEC